jgi:molecular chaperone GrpE
VDAAADGVTLEKVSEEIAGLRDLFQRRLLDDKDKRALLTTLQAEVQFFRSDLTDKILVPLFRELLLVLDRGASAGPEDELAQTLTDELAELLDRRGVRPLGASPTFDPAMHEAVATVPADEQWSNGSVTRVLRRWRTRSRPNPMLRWTNRSACD